MVEFRTTNRVEDRDVRTQLDRNEMIEMLKHGNIHEVFAKSTKFKINDFMEFFADQWRSWRGGVIQDTEIKAQIGSYPAPSPDSLPVYHREAKINQEEGSLFARTSAKALSMRASGTAGKLLETDDEAAAGDGSGSGPMTREEVESVAQDAIDELDQFTADTWEQVLDAQMFSDYQAKMGEVKSEVERIIALARSGAIGAEFVLIALAKVNVTKNGCLMSWMGQKAFKVNDSINKIANDLGTISPSDPRYVSEMQIANAKTRDGGYQLQLLTTDMQKIMQDVASTMEQVKSMTDEINRTKREIVSKFAAR